MSKAKKYFKLFISCFYISAFTFGGGFVIVPLIKKRFVDELGWLDESEMTDITAIAQTSPGAIAVNAAILTGYKTGGVPGALIAMIATVLPPMIIISVISFFYDMFSANAVIRAILKGMQAGVAAVICDVAITLGGASTKKNPFYIIIMTAAFTLTFFLDVSAVYIILGCILLAAATVSCKAAVKAVKAKRKTTSQPSEATASPQPSEATASPQQFEATASPQQFEDTALPQPSEEPSAASEEREDEE